MKHRGRFDQRTAQLAQRAWTDRERQAVWRGLTGRFAIAIEPLLGTVFLTLLTWGMYYRAAHVPSEHDLIKVGWVFGLGAALFLLYFIAVLVAPFIAYLQTYKPIYVIDGYVRYRPPDRESEYTAAGYVAALFEDRSVACEWECFGDKPLPERTIAAHVEFSRWAGVHRIDGKSTGLLEEDIPLLAVGIAPRKGPHPKR